MGGKARTSTGLCQFGEATSTPAPQLDRKRRLAIALHLPTHSAQQSALDARNRHAFIGELCGLPRQSIRSPSEKRMVPDKQKQPFRDRRAHFQHRSIRKHREALGRGGIDEIRVPSRNRADFFWFWSRPKPSRRSRIAKSQRARGEKRLCPRIAGTNHHFQRAALHFLGRARVDEMAWRQNQRPRRQNLRLPPMRKAQINNRSRLLGAHGCAL